MVLSVHNCIGGCILFHLLSLIKAGVIGDLEDDRDEMISVILTSLQSYMRYVLAKKTYADAIRRRDALDCIQTNIRAFQYLKEWEWMKIIFKIKPMISQAEEGKKMEELEKNYNDVKGTYLKLLFVFCVLYPPKERVGTN